jgi:hypothetical protein
MPFLSFNRATEPAAPDELRAEEDGRGDREHGDDDGVERKPILSARQVKRLNTLITQADGKPSVAPESDKRPALVMSADADFNDVTDLS